MSEVVICQYRVRDGALAEFLTVVEPHWSLLHRLGLVTDRPAEVLVGAERGLDGPFVVEVFEWVDADGSQAAHGHAEVAELWGRMIPLCEERGGRPAMDFPHFQPADFDR